MAWLKTPIQFTQRRAVLVLGPENLVEAPQDIWKALNDAFSESIDDPGHIQGLLMAIVGYYRPDLANAELLWYDYDFRDGCHKLGLSHPSLPICPMGAPAEYIRVVVTL